MSKQSSQKKFENIEPLKISISDFESFYPAKTPSFYNFKSQKIGHGMLGNYSPAAGINVFYAHLTPPKTYLWNSEKLESQENRVLFNYILHAPDGMRTSIDNLEARESLSSRTLLIDSTNSEHKSLLLIGNESFEIFQIAMTEKQFDEYMNTLIPKVTDEIKSYIQNHTYQKNRMGILLPFDFKEERCIREIINCPTKAELQQFFTMLKINELLMHYFSRIINKEILNIEGNESISLKERDKIVSIKRFIDDNIEKELDIDELSRIYNMHVSKIKSNFQKIFGYTISKYHRKKKINMAYSMLLNLENKMSVKEVAFTLNFNTTSSFSRAFYNEFNIRPSDINLKVEDMNFKLDN